MNETNETNEIRPYGAGKFRTMLDEAVFGLALCGGNEAVGDEWSPRHTLLLGWQDGDFALGALTAAERDFLRTNSAGAIVTENEQGFVSVEYYADSAALWADWYDVREEVTR